MAYKDSEELKADERYPLGDYSFRIERSSVPGSTNDKIEAICTKDSKNARKSIQVPSSTQMLGWYVEANSDTADVYILIKKATGSDKHTSVICPYPVASGGAPAIGKRVPDRDLVMMDGASVACARKVNQEGRIIVIGASATQSVWSDYDLIIETGEKVNKRDYTPGGYTYNGKTVYWNGVNIPSHDLNVPTNDIPTDIGDVAIAWTMIYGTEIEPEYGDSEEVLVGRFAIEIEDAGGVGPGSDWNDPEDYDDDWEPEEPTHTLNVEIDGALSGRHNDPLNDTSYSYLPSDKATVKDYGCGGDGGNGGGGGAGASSIVVYKFATDKANSKEIVCKPKRHGYGSGGGKGGKGGNGCILIYY